MVLSTALEVVSEFKSDNLKQTLNNLRRQLIGKGKNEIVEVPHVFEAALVVKQASAQINEIVHAAGIIKCLKLILDDDEEILDMSLASGADGEGIDLVTNKRIAEFKFSKWQEGKKDANGMRKRQVFSDLVQLYLNDTYKNKELYVFSFDKVMKFFQSSKADWKKTLSKSGGLGDLLFQDLYIKRLDYSSVAQIYHLSNVKVYDINEVLKSE